MVGKESLLKSVMAGICIGIGGIVYLSVENKVVGAALFATGLFTVCTMGYHLYTGKACYLLDSPNKGSYLIWLAQVWAGNLIGTVLVGYAMRLTRSGPALAEKAQALCQTKLGDSLLSIFILAIFCNIMIYIGVESYRSNPHPLGKYLGILLGIMVFILSGFEHCVANMFYFSVANAWSLTAVGYLLVMTAGNLVGAVLPEAMKKWYTKQEEQR
jgi:formate/nitrite transporter FocA (FNT family)